MKTIFLILSMMIATSTFATELSESLAGKYLANTTCYGNYTELTILDGEKTLSVTARAESGAWVIAKELILGTNGKKFNCTPPGNYTPVECKVNEAKNTISSSSRGCLIMCGLWNIDLSITQLSPTQIAVKISDDQKEACILDKFAE